MGERRYKLQGTGGPERDPGLTMWNMFLYLSVVSGSEFRVDGICGQWAILPTTPSSLSHFSPRRPAFPGGTEKILSPGPEPALGGPD